MRNWILYFILNIFHLSSFAQDSGFRHGAEVKAEINRLIKLKKVDLGFCLFSPEGKTIYSYQEQKNLTPASTLKIYTTIAAMHLLGVNYRYITYLEYDGHIDKCGVLFGNLFIRGTGDPTLGSERFAGYLSTGQFINTLGDEVKKYGITEIKGDVISDNSFFSECLTPESWPYDDRGNYYGAAPNGLNINENMYKLFFKPGKSTGSKTEIIGTDPINIPGLYIKNKVTTFHAGSGDRAVIMENPNNSVREVVGTIPAGKLFYIKGSTPDPAQLSALVFKQDLIKRGIKINGDSYSIFNASKNFRGYRNIIYNYQSPPLMDIISIINMRSHNLFAETLLVTLGKIYSGIGNHEKGLEVVLNYWSSQGVDIKKADIYDGSGLSPLNKISAYLLTQMLHTVKLDDSFQSFKQTLPVAGISGTLKNFCRNNTAKGKIFAKSGSIEGVKSYAGYVKTKSGNLLPFSLIINYQGNLQTLTSYVERLMVAMSNFP